MANLKIIRKPINKSEKVCRLIREKILNEHNSQCLSPSEIVDISSLLTHEIDSIYNAKEDDGVIDRIEIDAGQRKLGFSLSAVTSSLIISINDYMNSLNDYSLEINKQEACKLGEALIKLSKQEVSS